MGSNPEDDSGPPRRAASQGDPARSFVMGRDRWRPRGHRVGVSSSIRTDSCAARRQERGHAAASAPGGQSAASSPQRQPPAARNRQRPAEYLLDMAAPRQTHGFPARRPSRHSTGPWYRLQDGPVELSSRPSATATMQLRRCAIVKRRSGRSRSSSSECRGNRTVQREKGGAADVWPRGDRGARRSAITRGSRPIDVLQPGIGDAGRD